MGRPFEVLTDNGKQFTDRFTRPLPVEVLFERTCREYGITTRLTKRRSPTTTGKIVRFHRTLRRELLDETGAFATVEAAQAAIDEWVHAYNTARPHQSLDMAAPASLFRPRADVKPAPAGDAAEDTPARPGTAVPTDLAALEIELTVPPSGVVVLVGAQQVWIGKAFAGHTVTLWADLTSVHVLLDHEVLKTIVSRLTTADLQRLAMRGARPGRPALALPALGPPAPSTPPMAVEVDRTATRDGIVTLLGHELALGPQYARTRITLRIDGGLLHASASNYLIKTLPNPISSADLRRLTQTRRAATALPPPLAARPQSV